MIEEQAIVVDVDGHRVWVETRRQSACGRCAANKGCGSAVLQKVFGNKRNILPVTGDLAVNVGERVIIGVDEDSLVKGSVAVYAMPVAMMIIFAVIGDVLATRVSVNPDIMSIAGAVTGLAVSIAGLRWYSGRTATDARYQPVLLRHEHHADISKTQSEIRLLS